MHNIAYCGLACCVCAENKNCIGCQSGGCDQHGWCKNYICCQNKKLEGCWACDQFPCENSMLDKPRIRAFAEFTRRYGTEELKRCLIRNRDNGIVYHYSGQHIGDYDRCSSMDEIIEMVKAGIVPAELHYDMLIREDNDPVYDAEPLREYMNQWDGRVFIDELNLTREKRVLDIGVGTGRLAVSVAPLCESFTGIDISSETIARAKENLSTYENVYLICGDFMTSAFDEQKFHVIYSSLTFMHISDKPGAIQKIAGHLEPAGRFVLSIDKKQDTFIDMRGRKVRIYPDNPDDIAESIHAAHLHMVKRRETKFAYIFVAEKVL